MEQQGFQIGIYEAKEDDKTTKYLSILPGSYVFDNGLQSENIVGIVWGDAPNLSPMNVRPNPVFIEIFHECIYNTAITLPDLAAEAQRQGDGYVYIVDPRAPENQEVTPDDLVGAVEVKGGQFVEGSYSPNPDYLFIGKNGPCQLLMEYQTAILKRLMK